MRGIVCCLLLSSCTLDTTPSVGPWQPDASSRQAWMPAEAPQPKSRSDVAEGKAGSGTSASTASATGAPMPNASRPAAAASAKPSGSPSSPAPSPASMQAPPDPSPDGPPRPAQAVPLIDAGTKRVSTDAGGTGPTFDASLVDAASPEELLSWFGVRTTAAQRILLSALFDDLTGRQRADRDNLVSILNSFNDLDCVLNAQLCVQVCVWAATRCDTCTDDTCVEAMHTRCGFDCNGP